MQFYFYYKFRKINYTAYHWQQSKSINSTQNLAISIFYCSSFDIHTFCKLQSLKGFFFLKGRLVTSCFSIFFSSTDEGKQAVEKCSHHWPPQYSHRIHPCTERTVHFYYQCLSCTDEELLLKETGKSLNLSCHKCWWTISSEKLPSSAKHGVTCQRAKPATCKHAVINFNNSWHPLICYTD